MPCDTDAVRLRVSCPQLVGRHEELERLEAALAGVLAGEPATVLVHGDAGVGKSRLVEELAERAGLSARYIGGIERAAVSASVTVLGRIAEALEVEACELIRETRSRGRTKTPTELRE